MSIPSSAYKSRIAQLKRLLAGTSRSSAALISSNPIVQSSHDQSFPYRQNSNLYYLTGSLAPDILLLVSSTLKKPILFAPPTDKLKVVWEGPVDPISPIANRIGAELVVTKSPIAEAIVRLDGTEELYSQNIPGSLSWKTTLAILERPGHTQSTYPRRFAQLDILMQELRLYKTTHEVNLIKEAALRTNFALFEAARRAIPGCKEWQIAQTIDFHFGMQGARPGFDTIVATGPSAATLHYTKYSRTLRKGELLLIDCGASYQMYNADITRTIPVGGEFSPIGLTHYQIVLEAQHAAIRAVKDGVKIKAVMDSAVRVLTEGLKELGVLKGKTSSLIAKKAYKPYFPHGIGHSLGIDVHDISETRGNSSAVLKKGMVFTIEPGLYFQKKEGRVPASGVRIEDDILVTPRGAEILTAGFPKETKDIKRLF